jgi:hypothetical protein
MENEGYVICDFIGQSDIIESHRSMLSMISLGNLV